MYDCDSTKLFIRLSDCEQCYNFANIFFLSSFQLIFRRFNFHQITKIQILCPMLNILGRFSQVYRIVREQNADGISLTTWILTAYTSSGM